MERLIIMSHTKKKPPVLARAHTPNNQVNKKALIWIGAVLGFIVVALGTLLILKV
jgi:hypothetical protein